MALYVVYNGRSTDYNYKFDSFELTGKNVENIITDFNADLNIECQIVSTDGNIHDEYPYGNHLTIASFTTLLNLYRTMKCMIK